MVTIHTHIYDIPLHHSITSIQSNLESLTFFSQISIFTISSEHFIRKVLSIAEIERLAV